MVSQQAMATTTSALDALDLAETKGVIYLFFYRGHSRPPTYFLGVWNQTWCKWCWEFWVFFLSNRAVFGLVSWKWYLDLLGFMGLMYIYIYMFASYMDPMRWDWDKFYLYEMVDLYDFVWFSCRGNYPVVSRILWESDESIQSTLFAPLKLIGITIFQKGVAFSNLSICGFPMFFFWECILDDFYLGFMWVYSVYILAICKMWSWTESIA